MNSQSHHEDRKSPQDRGLTRRAALAGLAAALLTVLLVASAAPAQARPGDEAYSRCARACADCRQACLACVRHCRGMVRAGMTEHIVSERLSDDCADLCAVSAKLCARRGPMAVAACQATLQAARTCAAECRKYPAMSVMVACARSCDACADACRAMTA